MDFFFFGGGGGATVSEFLLLRIQIQNKKKIFLGGSGWRVVGEGVSGYVGGGGGAGVSENFLL